MHNEFRLTSFVNGDRAPDVLERHPNFSIMELTSAQIGGRLLSPRRGGAVQIAPTREEIKEEERTMDEQFQTLTTGIVVGEERLDRAWREAEFQRKPPYQMI